MDMEFSSYFLFFYVLNMARKKIDIHPCNYKSWRLGGHLKFKSHCYYVNTKTARIINNTFSLRFWVVNEQQMLLI